MLHSKLQGLSGSVHWGIAPTGIAEGTDLRAGFFACAFAFYFGLSPNGNSFLAAAAQTLPQTSQLRDAQEEERKLRDEISRLEKALDQTCREGAPGMPPLERQKVEDELPRPPSPRPEERKSEEVAAAPAEPPSKQAPAKCDVVTAPPPANELTVVLDRSQSMFLPNYVSAAEERDLERRIRARDASALARVRALLNSPDRKRFDDARAALETIAPKVHPQTSLGLVTLDGCDAITNHGFFQQGDRQRFLGALEDSRKSGGSPIARAMERAGNSLSQARAGSSIMLIITDGNETCGGNPCAVAAQLKQQVPNLIIHVISVVNDSNLRCVADATGGKVYLASDVSDIERNMQQATAIAQIPVECLPQAAR